MKRWIIITATMCFAIGAWSAEYRNFTNQEGKTIAARVVDYDEDAGKVLLELKNRRKAWVDLFTLSGEDQQYIISLNRTRTAETGDEKKIDTQEKKPNTFSRQELKKIGQKFTRAATNDDYDTWKSMLSGNQRDQHKYNIERMQRDRVGGDVSMGAVDEEFRSIELKIVRSLDAEVRWLFILPDGTIKYDALISRHPLEEAVNYLKRLSERNHSSSLQMLYTLKIPCYEYKISAPSRERNEAIEKIAKWIIATDGDWDNLEPKCQYPPDGFKMLIHELKNL